MAELPPAQRVASVDLGAIAANLRTVRSGLKPTTHCIAVVKANGYGHGATTVARAALEAGAWGLAVSTLPEAVELRGLAPPERLLALGGLTPDDAPAAASVGCSVACHSWELANALEQAVPTGSRLSVQLKVDTGMSRLGCSLAEAPQLARRIAGSDRLALGGVYTHFAASDSDAAFTREQYSRFVSVLEQLQVEPGLRHAANSCAALRHPELQLDAVRIGIALYGCEWPSLRPALTFQARVTQVSEIPAGSTVGYDRTWRAERSSRVAVIAAGYADGVMRARSGRGDVVIRGQRRPVIGRISMDQMTADVTGDDEVRAGDWATLIGDGISAEEVAGHAGTNSYEVLTSIGRRVIRRYQE